MSILIADLNGSKNILIVYANIKLLRNFEIMIAVKLLLCYNRQD